MRTISSTILGGIVSSGLLGYGLNQCLKAPIDWNRSINGVHRVTEDPIPRWSWSNYVHGTFQRDFSQWFDRHCSGRELTLRLFNQCIYSGFNSSFMLGGGLIIAPNGDLNQLDFVLDAMRQTSPTKFSDASKLFAQISQIRRALQRQGKALIILTTPSKPVTQPQTIPPRFQSLDPVVTRRPYESFIELMHQSDIPFVDGARIVHEAQSQADCPTFVRGGVHWDSYGASLVLAPLVSRISEVTRKPLPKPVVKEVIWRPANRSALETDRDLAELLNLARPPDDYLCPNATIEFQGQPSGRPPSFTMVGGSFCRTLLELMQSAPADQFSLPDYAFYGSENYWSNVTKRISREVFEVGLSSSELVVLEINETLPRQTIDSLPALIDEVGAGNFLTVGHISFEADGSSSKYLVSGFGEQESWGRWTTGTSAMMYFTCPGPPQDYTLTARVQPFVTGTLRSQRVGIAINGGPKRWFELKIPLEQTLELNFRAGGPVAISFDLPDATSPFALHAGSDRRTLGLGFHAVDVSARTK